MTTVFSMFWIGSLPGTNMRQSSESACAAERVSILCPTLEKLFITFSIFIRNFPIMYFSKPLCLVPSAKWPAPACNWTHPPHTKYRGKLPHFCCLLCFCCLSGGLCNASLLQNRKMLDHICNVLENVGKFLNCWTIFRIIRTIVRRMRDFSSQNYQN